MSPLLSKSPLPIIEIENLTRSFDGNLVFENLTFSVLPTETLCILGRSGAGKSVLLAHIMGFLKPESGRIIVMGEDINRLDEQELERAQRKVTIVFQSGALFDSLTTEENVAFPLRERLHLPEGEVCRSVATLLESFALKELKDRYPAQLSTGMKRSVAIARAVAARTPCVLYDEPTNMVDPLTAKSLARIIKQLKVEMGVTNVIVTHDMRLTQTLADRIVFLERAKVIFFGTFPEMTKCPHPVVQKFIELDLINMKF